MPVNEARTPRRLLLRSIPYASMGVCIAVAAGFGRHLDAERTGSPYRGELTFSTPGAGDPFSPAVVQDYDLNSGALTVRFDGLDASQTARGETAYLSRLANGWAADHGVVVADSRGVPGAPLHICKDFNWSSNAGCHTPKLSPDGRLVAFGARGGDGSVCKNSYGMYWGDFVVVTDRRGAAVSRFEGYGSPEWLPDGRLLMMGTQCRNAGVWLSDRTIQSVNRIDGNQVSTPAGGPAISPDGKQLAFVWNRQLWSLTLTGRPELNQLTRLPKSVFSAAWSPDGSALAVLLFDVSMPIKTVGLFRPGDERSLEFRTLSVYPYGPLTWH